MSGENGVIKPMGLEPVTESFARLGYPPRLALGIGALELACLAVDVIPRIGSPVGVLVWGGLFLREARLRALIPLRRERA